MQTLHRLLALVLNWNKPHMWATNRFANSLSINYIIFA